MMRNSLCLVLLLLCAPTLFSQNAESDAAASPVPTVLKFSNAVRDLDGNRLSGSRNLTFALYKDRQGGASIWAETQTVTLDTQGRYTAMLGSSTPGGVPVEIFASGETQWVGVTPEDGVQRPRFPITTVPYAFKAAEAETLGGRKPEEFVSLQQMASLLANRASQLSLPLPPVVTLGIGISAISNAPIPDVNAEFLHGFPDSAFAKLNMANIFSETQNLAGGIRLPAIAPEQNQNSLLDSAPLDFGSSIAQAQSGAYLEQVFRWISQPGEGSSRNPAARLSLLFGVDPATPAATGFSFNSDGTINFAPGQQFPQAAVLEAISAGQSGSSGGAAGGNEPPVVNTVSYRWTQTPSGSGIKAGPNAITLTPCPAGVNGNDAWHYLYISNTGTPEVILITGGSCVARAKSGTIEFTAKYDHASGYSIGSATDGVQESTIGTSVAKSGGQISRNVMIDPGSHLFRARLSIRATGITITGSGATIICAMSDTCIMLGDPSNSIAFDDITLSGIRVVPGIPNGTWPAVEDNANGSTISNLSPAAGSVSGASFGSLVQVDNDQAAQITALSTNLAAWSRCDTSFCSTAIVGPGAAGDSGVIWVKNSNLALNCTANGIDNENGNTLHVSDTVVEGYPQFGIRSRVTYGTVPTAQLDSVYEEIGGCTNPLGTGMAGLIVENGYANVSASVGPAGQLPTFANSGTTQYNYSIVVHSSVMGTSPAYLAGYANTSGAGAIPVIWNQIGNTGVVTYDLLRTTGVGAPAPFGTGSFAVATGIPATSCSNKVCSFVDDASSPLSSYTVSTETPYWPAQKLWPGMVILTTAYDYQNTGGGEPTLYFTDVLNGSQGAGIVNSAGGFAPSVFAQLCQPQGATSSVWEQCLGGNAVSNDNPVVTGTVLQLSNNGGSNGGLKGRLIFEIPPNSSTSATHVITLADSNPAKTMASPNNRPAWDANDAYIGYDQPDTDVSHTQLSFGAPESISHYIGNPGDNINWGERLTKSEKTFQVPVQAQNVTVNGNLITNGPCLGIGCGPFSPSGEQVSDPFTGGTLGPNWTVIDGACSIVNNQLQLMIGSDNLVFCAYTTGTFTTAQFAQAKAVALNTGYNGLCLDMASDGETGYCLAGLSSNASLSRWSGGIGNNVAMCPGINNGDTLYLVYDGITLTAYDNGTKICSGATSGLSAGYPGFFGENLSGATFSSFVAGNLSYSTGAQVGFAKGSQDLPDTYANFPACGAGTQGTKVTIIDSTTNEWGAPISGEGSYVVGAFCNGTNWTVYAK